MTERSSWASGSMRAAGAPSWVKIFCSRFSVAITILLFKAGGEERERDETELRALRPRWESNPRPPANRCSSQKYPYPAPPPCCRKPCGEETTKVRKRSIR